MRNMYAYCVKRKYFKFVTITFFCYSHIVCIILCDTIRHLYLSFLMIFTFICIFCKSYDRYRTVVFKLHHTYMHYLNQIVLLSIASIKLKLLFTNCLKYEMDYFPCNNMNYFSNILSGYFFHCLFP
uniref:Uncharacterized protein n=1 Tax=Heterorhabditis bacteriophora TaxID=37862 RepID=A0A1I7WC01_HETBA